MNKERAKVKSLSEVINKEKQVIETWQKKAKAETSNIGSEKVWCHYWNRGYFKNGDECQYHHSDKDCETYLKTDKCDDRKCKKRHRKLCRYFKTKAGCYRN